MVSFLTVVVSALKRKKMQNTWVISETLELGYSHRVVRENQSQHLEVKFDLTPG